jgi:hypothetical protein
MLANMNETVRPAGNRAPVVAARVDYSKGEYDGWGAAGVYGNAPNFINDTPNTTVGLIEVDGYFIRGDWTLQGQVSYGMQQRAAITADPVTGEYRDASWYGCRRWQRTSSRRAWRASHASTTSTTARMAAACSGMAPTASTASAPTQRSTAARPT